MPRNVRNFWIELDVDGNKTRIATGPRNKDGGFSLRIMQRHNGMVSPGLRVYGFVDGGLLKVVAQVDGDALTHTTPR